MCDGAPVAGFSCNSVTMSGDPNGSRDKDSTVSKTAGIVVFSGIALSILKTLNAFNKKQIENPTNTNKHNTCSDSIQSIEESKPPPVFLPEPIIKAELTTCDRTVEISKGDTLWGLSRRYGVSIDAIKEANGVEGDTIYAGRKLVIP